MSSLEVEQESVDAGKVPPKRKLWIFGLIALLVGGAVIVILFNPTQTKSGSGTDPIYSPKGDLVIKPQFASVLPFQDGMAEYSLRASDAPLLLGKGTPASPFTFNLTDELSGFVSKTGSILAPNFQLASTFSEGLAAVSSRKGYFGFVDTEGKWAIPDHFRYVGNFSNGLAVYQDKSLKYGYIDKQGKIAIPAQWDSANGFSEGRAVVCNGYWPNWLCGYIDTTNRAITPMIYSDAETFSEGHAQVCIGIDSKGKCGYIDSAGKVALEIKYPEYPDEIGTWNSPLGSFYNGLALVLGAVDGVKKWGFFDMHMKFAVPLTLTSELDKGKSDAWDFDAGLQWETVGASKDSPGQAAAIDSTGHIKFFSTYEDISAFSQGISGVKVHGKWGFINQKNEMVVKPQFDEIGYYSEGLAAVRIDGKWGFIN